MTDDQLLITGGSEPVSWDGEPLFCAETISDGLFDREAFTQFAGQLALDTDDEEQS